MEDIVGSVPQDAHNWANCHRELSVLGIRHRAGVDRGKIRRGEKRKIPPCHAKKRPGRVLDTIKKA